MLIAILQHIFPADGSYPEPQEDDDNEGDYQNHEEGDSYPDKGCSVHTQGFTCQRLFLCVNNNLQKE